ncbi:MAG: hypothetical protein ACD_51C00028G0025 [uncultured bacterium]|nr:MAG: hypothetical protein ACD_51C00028G0025 [uncultured bacterium]OGJ47889.1 MAG: hypothetical protein A2244_05420 [Candidatus Peregrinibacteria bacterium RIFOXYA2_FULL_41_18]OGJ52472.1 MAG: hypothetical protein A2336_01435 [Candidatus Peregrinibacteria bacterium RIFOXYB2_FULL_41_88]OGJ53312.1 MAG: hypothetical protein A2448_01455 [Candidatus Peregrinibacteria bacterium RIFOXYC2_FULL_41_22]
MPIEEGQPDPDIYTPETRALLQEADMTPEDVHAVATFTGAFQRRVLSLTDETERRRISLIRHVERDEQAFISVVSDEFFDVFDKKKHRGMVRSLGKDIRKWSALKTELGKSKAQSLTNPLLLFLLEEFHLFQGEDGRFEKLLEFMRYYNNGASTYAVKASCDEFGRNFREIESDGMLDIYLDTCLKNKTEWESTKRPDRHYGSWAFQFAKLTKVFKGDRKIFDELADMNLSVFGCSKSENFNKIYQEDMVKLRRVYGVLDKEYRSGLSHGLFDLAISVAKPGDVDEFEQAFSLIRSTFKNDLPWGINDTFRENLPKFKAYCVLMQTLNNCYPCQEFLLMSEDMLLRSAKFVKDNKRDAYFSRELVVIFAMFDSAVLDDESMMQIYRDLSSLYPGRNFSQLVIRLVRLAGVYRTDPSKFGLLIRDSGGRLDSLHHMVDIDDYQDLFGDDLSKLNEVLDCLNGLGGHAHDAGRLRDLADFYRGDFDKFKAFIKAVGAKLGIMDREIHIENYKNLFGQDVDKLSTVLDELISLDPKNVNDLKALKDLHGDSMDRFKIVVLFLRKSPVSDTAACARFIEEYERGGEPAARDYLDDQVEKSKTLIGSSLPEELRAAREYMFYVKRVFPKGNYSDHDKNVACGDNLEHLSGYHYDRQGYPVQMTGLLGYRLKDGAEEDVDKLESYQRRLNGIRSFVASRGPDNKALRKAFEEKVEAMFKSKARAFASLPNLSVKEQMLALFLTEVIRKAKESASYKPDAEVTDLIVEYKYAFQEDLEAYVVRTADEARKGKDEVSQHFVLWRELSTIYGENVKHILRHDIFGELSKEGGNTAALEECFSRAMPGDGEDLKLKSKQRDTLAQTFDNERIQHGKKRSVLQGQCVRIFGANIKFGSDAARTSFDAELDNVLQELASVGRMEKAYFFETSVPKLLVMRQRYVLDVNSRLENLFSYDINRINEEIAKFDEVLEVEAKQTTMGGDRSRVVEKSAKKRNIRGYFTKTKETANARMGAYLCIAGDEKMWKNPNYFEMVMKDEDTGKCVGLTMLLRIDAKNGKKYLWFGPNPFEGFLGQVSSEQCYRYQYSIAVEFARANGFDGIVVPSQDGQILGACTNRGGDFPDLLKASRLRDQDGQLKIVRFGEKHELGGTYGYEDGVLIWEREAA